VTLLATDAFNRTVAAGGWGNADTGGAYALSGGSTSFSVNGTKGVITLPPGGTRTALLSTTSTTSVSQVSVAADKTYAGGAGSFNVIGRRVGVSNYAARVRVENPNLIRMYILYNETAITGASYVLPVTYTAGMVLNIKLSVTGTSPTTVAAKVWAAGTSEPTSWNLQGTDNTTDMQVAGIFGIGAQLSSSSTNNPMIMTFENYSVNSTTVAPSQWTHLGVWNDTTKTEWAVTNVSVWDGTTENAVEDAYAYVEPVVAGSATAGAAALGSMSYPVPTGSVHVYPGDSVQAAFDNVSTWGTIVLHGGTHRVATELKTKRSCIIQNEPGKEVWLDGSKVVTGWTNNGNNTYSATYTCKPRMNLGGTLWGSKDNAAGVVIPDQCWINGVRQFTIADDTIPAAGQVSFNPATSRVTIYGDPTGKIIEASEATTMLLQTHPLILRGIGIRRSSPTWVEWQGGAVYTGNERQISGSLYENLHVVDHGNYGMFLSGAEDVTVADNTFTDCGMAGLGIGSAGMNGSVPWIPLNSKTGTVERNVFKRINFKKWNAEPTTACIKTVGSNKLDIRNNHFSDFYFCCAIWYDISCVRIQVVGNYIDGTPVVSGLNKKGGKGVEVELSDGGGSGSSQERSLIAGNTIIGCEYSIMILCTGHHDVVNNTIDGGDGIGTAPGGGIYIQQDARTGNTSTRPDYRPTEAPWFTRYNRFYNNRIKAGRRQWFITGGYTISGTRYAAMDYFDSGISIDGNWAEPYGTGNDFLSIQNHAGSYTGATTWAGWKSLGGIGNTTKIGNNGQGTWVSEAAAAAYAVPLEPAWATALGKDLDWKGVGNPLPAPIITPGFTLGVTKPDATNTGVPAGTTFTQTITTDITYSTPQTITAVDFACHVTLTAPVTFINCRFRGRNIGFVDKYALVTADSAGATGSNFDRCTFNPDYPRFWLNAIKGQGFTANRCDVSAVVDGFQIRYPATCTITGNYLHDFYFSDESTDQAGSDPPYWTHNDGVAFRVEGASASQHVVRGNNFHWYPGLTADNAKFNRNAVLYTGVPGTSYTHSMVSTKTNRPLWGCAITNAADFGPYPTNVLITENWFEGGTACFQSNYAQAQNFGEVSKNRIGGDQYQYSGGSYQLRWNSSVTVTNYLTNYWDNLTTVSSQWRGVNLTLGQTGSSNSGGIQIEAPTTGPPTGYTTYSAGAATFDAGVDANKKTYLPAGTYTFSDFLYPSNPTMGAMLTNCESLAGAGMNNTTIKMNANTSTKLSGYNAILSGGANPYNLIWIGDESVENGPKVTVQDLTIAGTTQPHPYNGIQIARSLAPVVRNVKVQGIPGNSSTPPGETFSLSLYRAANATIENCILDGRRDETGVAQAASLLGINNSDHVTVTDTIIRYTNPAFAVAGWQSTGGDFTRVTFDHNGRVPIHLENTDGVWNFRDCTWSATDADEFHAVIATSKNWRTGQNVLNIYDPEYDNMRGNGKFWVRFVLWATGSDGVPIWQNKTVGSGTTPGAVNLYVNGVLRPDLVSIQIG
jgi:hypothetical protein